PAELREHEIMETLITCRSQWNRVKGLEVSSPIESTPVSDAESEDVSPEAMEIEAAATGSGLKEPRVKKAKKSKKKTEPAATKTAKDVEMSFADLDDLHLTVKKAKKPAKNKSGPAVEDNSDFGEEESLDAKEA